MIKKKIIDPDSGFSFIPHRFVSDGFLAFLQQKELLLYLFLVTVSDRHGLSFYGYDAIYRLLQFDLEPIHQCQRWSYGQGSLLHLPLLLGFGQLFMELVYL